MIFLKSQKENMNFFEPVSEWNGFLRKSVFGLCSSLCVKRLWEETAETYQRLSGAEVCWRCCWIVAIRSISDYGHNYRSIETSSGNTITTFNLPTLKYLVNIDFEILKYFSAEVNTLSGRYSG